ncbi:MAG: enoyl-CoA hydratase-related protein [Dehalococcoidia bacterium]
MNDYQDIRYGIDGAIATITLNRPEKMNALSNNLRGEMVHALKEAEFDPAVSVIVLRGAGRSFSAGYDIGGGREAGEASRHVHPRSRLPDVGSTRPGPSEWALHVNETNWQAIWENYKPIIARVHGYCLAGGTELATICDFRIVTEDAIIGYPPVRAMTTMDMMWTPWHLPMAKAREFAYLGDTMTGLEAAHWGWANRAVPAERLDETVEWFARRLALVDREMLMYSKRAVNRAYEVMGIRTALNAGADIQALSAMRPMGGVFGRISRAYGLKEALAWRDGPFGDFRTKGNPTPRKDYPDITPQGRPGQG